MGFECGFQLVPKFDNITAKQSLASWRYCDYIDWLKTDWCQEQIKNGYKLSFEDSCAFTLDDLPSEEILQKYRKIFEAKVKSKADYSESIFNVCGIGEKLDKLIRARIKKSSEALDKEKAYFEFTREDIETLNKYSNEKLLSMLSIPVSITSGYKEKGNEIEEIELDGIYGEMTTSGQLVNIPINSIIEWCTAELDIDERDLFKDVKEFTSMLLSHLNFETTYVIYYKSE